MRSSCSTTSSRAPIGKRGAQVLREVIQERAASWHTPLIEYVVTAGQTGDPYVAIHEVTYGEDGQHRFDAVRLPIGVAARVAVHVGGLTEEAQPHPNPPETT